DTTCADSLAVTALSAETGRDCVDSLPACVILSHSPTDGPAARGPGFDPRARSGRLANLRQESCGALHQGCSGDTAADDASSASAVRPLPDRDFVGLAALG